MKKFIIKTIVFVLLLTGILLLFICSSDYFFKDSVCSGALEDKIISLTGGKENIDIIAAGDSRAEKQINPVIIENKTGLTTVNIAVSVCDLVTLYNALKKYDLLSKNTTFLISASMFHVNDGAIDPGYISRACVYNMTIPEKISVFGKKPLQLLHLYRRELFAMAGGYIKETFSKNKNPLFYKEKGFGPEEGHVKLPIKIILNPEKTEHPWYKNINLNGAKWRIFKKTLSELSEGKCKIIIFNPPASPAWKDYTKNSFIDIAEKKYSAMLNNETKKYKNMTFIDFYAKTYPELTNGRYVDIQHLNKRGAEIFTNLLTNDLIRSGDLCEH